MERLAAKLGDRLQQNKSLARFTAARLGGNAEWLYIARDDMDELIEVVTYAWGLNMPVQILGGGANVLVSDNGVSGLVVVNHITEIKRGQWHEGRNLSVTAGTKLTTLARHCHNYGLTGMEWAISVPGTIGGAIVNNAGAHGVDMADSIADVVVLEPNGARLYSCDELDYSYRSSMLKQREDKRFLVLLATLILPKGNPEQILAKMDEYQTYRKRTQPQGASLGSIFKNPQGDYAGRLIEMAGLKGYRIGNAQVSEKHANFFINVGGVASSEDYYQLVQHVQQAVHEHSGVKLEPEIQFIGEFD